MVVFHSECARTISRQIVSYLCVFSLFLLVFTSTASYAAKKIPCAEGSNITPYLGTYKVTGMMQYQTGRTTETEAKKKMEREMILSEKLFSIGDFFVEHPSYQLKCYQLPEGEGEVPLRSERWSNFYGLGLDRKIIKELKIYDLKNQTNSSKFSLEIIDNDEIWEMLTTGGWLYIMKKEK
jgi:hypothetical protein